MGTPIADLRLVGTYGDGPEVPVHIWVMAPYRNGDSWCCLVGVDDLYPNLADTRGEDSFQALVLGIRLIQRLLSSFVERGGRLRYAHETPSGDIEAFPMDAYFAIPEGS